MTYLGLENTSKGKRKNTIRASVATSLCKRPRTSYYKKSEKFWHEYTKEELDKKTLAEKILIPAPLNLFIPLQKNISLPLESSSPVASENKSRSEPDILQPQDKGKAPVYTVSEATQEDISSQSQSSYSLSEDSQSDSISDEASPQKPPKRRSTNGYQESGIFFEPNIQSDKKLSSSEWCQRAGLNHCKLTVKETPLKLTHLLRLHAVKLLNDKKLTIEILRDTNFDDNFITTFEDKENTLKEFENKFDANVNWQFEYVKSNKEKLGNLYNVLNRLYYINNIAQWSSEAKLGGQLYMAKNSASHHINLQQLVLLQLVLEKPNKAFKSIKELTYTRETSSITEDNWSIDINDKFLENLKDTYQMLAKNLHIKFPQDFESKLKQLKIGEKIEDLVKNYLLSKEASPESIGEFVKFALSAKKAQNGQNSVAVKGFTHLTQWAQDASLTINIFGNRKCGKKGSFNLRYLLMLLKAYQKTNSNFYKNNSDIPINNDFIKCLNDMKDKMEEHYNISKFYSDDVTWLQQIVDISNTLGIVIALNDVIRILEDKTIKDNPLEKEQFLQGLKEKLTQHTQATSSGKPQRKRKSKT